MNLNHKIAVPRNAQVEKLLREIAKKQEYVNGLPLPKEIDLVKRLGISRNTLHKATNKLVYKGLLTRKKGVGTFVVKKNIPTNLDNWLNFTQQMNEMGVSFINYEVKAKFIKPSPEVAKILGIAEDKKVLRLDHIRGDDNGPFARFISYFHSRIGLSGKEDFTNPLHNILENDFSTIPSYSREKMKAIKGTKEVGDKLNLRIGDPVLLRKREVLDPGKRIIEYNVC